jgi:hypothetical protein
MGRAAQGQGTELSRVHAAKGLPAGSIDVPVGGKFVHRGPLIASGWALGPDGPMSEVLVLVNGRNAVGAELGRGRDDVAELHPGVADADRSGWQAQVDVRGVEASTATLELLGRTGGGEWAELDRTQVEIEEPGIFAGRPRAVFTIAKNEGRFLPVWVNHYRRHFDPADIYVLDHQSTDGSAEGVEDLCNVVRVYRDKSFDHMWLKSTVEDFQAFLLRSYGAVLFTDVDEIVVPDPDRYPDLGAYIDAIDGPARCCTGYNVIHYPEEGEPALRFDQPLLRQRRWWHPSPQYSKRLLGRIPLSWNVGIHIEFNAPSAQPDPDLCLIHLHRIDYEYCLARHQDNVSREWPEEDLKFNLSWHQRVTDPEEFDEWFYTGDDLEGNDRVPIPERFKDLI